MGWVGCLQKKNLIMESRRIRSEKNDDNKDDDGIDEDEEDKSERALCLFSHILSVNLFFDTSTMS